MSVDVVRADIEGHAMKLLDALPLGERIQCGKRVERFVGTGDLPNFFRKPYGPGWALVGDAGYHKDPNGAQGICDAFRDAELLADAVNRGLSGRQSMDDALAAYEGQRNEQARPGFDLNFQMATLEPLPPEMQRLFGALCGNQPDTDRLIGAIVGTVPIPEYFAPANVERILGASRC